MLSLRSGTSPPHPVAAFLQRLADRGSTGLRLALSGPAGSGKSTLLDDIEEECRHLGIEVLRDATALGVERPASDTAVIVDDVQELSVGDLARLDALLLRPDLHIVLAYRSWPHPPALRLLTETLERRGRVVELRPLTRPQIAARLHAAGVGGSDTFADELLAATGGLAWLVHRAIERRAGTTEAGETVLFALLHEVGEQVRRLRPDLQELMLALAAGFDPVSWARWRRVPLADVVDEARASGLLLADDTIPPLLRDGVLTTAPSAELQRMQRALVDQLFADDRPLAPLARGLARAGFRDPRIARALERSADAVLATDPDVAAALYREADAAGGDRLATAARRAQAAYALGDVDEAGRLVDGVLSQEEPADLARAVDVAAAVWAQRGMLSHSAATYRWLGPDPSGAAIHLGVVTFVGVGDPAEAERFATSPAAGTPPTLARVALSLLAHGVRCSVSSTGEGALAALVRASDSMTSAARHLPLPETPAALAALVALHTGEIRVAESVLEAALAERQGGEVAQPRLVLLRAWTAMQAGHPTQARQLLRGVTAGTDRLLPRDEFLARVLDVALARRADDAPALVRAWRQARESALHVPVDLFSLLPLGELAVAAARMRDSHRLSSHLTEAWALLDRLGNPPVWSVPLHWAAVQAAILAERPRELAPHATALVRASADSRVAAILASAGRAWMAVLAGDFDVVAVEAAARGLASVGLPWDGSRLAGHAAAHAEDRAEMTHLLACARELHAAGDTDAEVTEGGAPSLEYARPRSEVQRDESGLSAREREVARLMLEGKNYREIGEAIFISPRTVEHHVARIRQRLDAKNRSELLSELRLVLDAGEARGSQNMRSDSSDNAGGARAGG